MIVAPLPPSPPSLACFLPCPKQPLNHTTHTHHTHHTHRERGMASPAVDEDEEDFPLPPDMEEDDGMMVEHQQQHQHTAATLQAGTMPSHHHYQHQQRQELHGQEGAGGATVEEWRTRCEEGKKRMKTLLDSYHVCACEGGSSSGRKGGNEGGRKHRGGSWGRSAHSHTNHTTTTITHRHPSQNAKPLSIKKSKPCTNPGRWTLCHITCNPT